MAFADRARLERQRRATEDVRRLLNTLGPPPDADVDVLLSPWAALLLYDACEAISVELETTGLAEAERIALAGDPDGGHAAYEGYHALAVELRAFASSLKAKLP